MKTLITHMRTALLAILTAVLLASPVQAVPQVRAPSVPETVIMVSGNCHAIGMQHASQSGGQLLKATPEVRGGQQVCVIVVAMPARDGQRPRRTEVVVPAG